MNQRRKMRILAPIVALLFFGVLVLWERRGISLQYARPDNEVESLQFTDDIEQETSCLLLTDESDEASKLAEAQMEIVLDGMDISYDVKDATDFSESDDLSKYQIIIISFQNWELISDSLDALFHWVETGGNIMNTLTPSPSGSFFAVSQKLGIQSGGKEYTSIAGLKIWNDCMIGSEEQTEFPFDLEDSEEVYSSLSLELSKSCEVYVTSLDESVPIIWGVPYGKGQIVMLNDVITDKYQRGFLSLAYSLLGEVCIYPVMNASAFYLDDFPAPVPEGDSTYIKRDYGVDTSTFYATIWWPQMLSWEEKYGIYHTGLIIEKYSDQVSGTFSPNESTSQFLSYGNMLLNNGGELGFHGYNHQPLCLEGIDAEKQYGTYNLWPSETDIENSLSELDRFSKSLFPEEDFEVYVPPSNILSDSGKEALLDACPNIKIIASTYLVDAEEKAYDQEFEIEENGIIDTPRIVSGTEIGNYGMLSALSELNFQLVQSHFLHPDDVLDADRGAEDGWETMSEKFESYLDWVYQSVPSLRNVTGSGMGAIVEGYSKISMQRSLEDNVLNVKLGGFSGSAYFLMRINEGEYVAADGCSCEKVAENLYLIATQQDTFQIQLGE